MKKTFLSLLVLLLPSFVHAQGLNIGTGTVLSLGSSTFALAGNWENAGTFNAETGTIAFTGPSGSQTINNAAGETFYNLTVDKTADTAQLLTNITVTGTLTMTGGDLDLNGFTLSLGPSATVNESNDSTIKGDDGEVETTVALAAPNNVNIAGLGAVLSSVANLGAVTVKRGHFQHGGGGNSTILRYYDISPEFNDNLNATLVFHYDESELNGLVEENLKLLRSTDGGVTWATLGGVVDTANNTVTLTGIAAFSLWTLGASDPPAIANIEGDALKFTEASSPSRISATITLTDPDDTLMEGATIAITGNYHSNQDMITFTGTENITGSWDSSTGTMTLSGTAALAEYQTALRKVCYYNRSSSPATETRTITITVYDGTVNSNPLSRTVTLTAISAPTLAITAPNGSELWESGATTFIQWYSYEVMNGTLEYSMDGGESWIMIDSAVDVRNGSYPWTVPDGASAHCLVRISGTGDPVVSDVSDSTFTIKGDCPVTVTGFGLAGSDVEFDDTVYLLLDVETPDAAVYEDIRFGTCLSYDDTTVTLEEWYGSRDLDGDGDIDTLSIAAALPVGLFELPESVQEITVGVSEIIVNGLSFGVERETSFSTILLPPTNITAQWLHDDESYAVMLSWDVSADDEKVEAYRIYRSVAVVLKEARAGKAATLQAVKDDSPVLIATVGKGTTSFADTTGLDPRSSYLYQIRAVSGIAKSEPAEITIAPVDTAIDESPLAFKVYEAYPNPFNPSTTIMYSVPEECKVTLTVYDIVGHRIAVLRNETVSAGTHHVTWNATDDRGTLVSSGVYLFRITAGAQNATGKVMYIR